MAARMMFDQIHDMSTNNFQELKSYEFQILSHDNVLQFVSIYLFKAIILKIFLGL